MSSVGQALGYVAGGLIGAFIPGGYVLLGAAIGGMIGGAIDPPKGPTIEGPRLSDTTVQLATYGAVLPRVHGNMKVSGTVVWVENNQLKKVRTEKKVGGKGGSKQKQVTNTYYATFFLALTDGEFSAVRRIWFADKLVYDAGAYVGESAADAAGRAIATAKLGEQITVFYGSADQQPSARMQMTLGVENTPAYRGIGGLLFQDIDLTDYGNSLLGLQVKVELVGQKSYETIVLHEQAYPITSGISGTNRYPYSAVSAGYEGSVIGVCFRSQWSGLVSGSEFISVEHGVRTTTEYVPHPIDALGGSFNPAIPVTVNSTDIPAVAYLYAHDVGENSYSLIVAHGNNRFATHLAGAGWFQTEEKATTDLGWNTATTPFIVTCYNGGNLYAFDSYYDGRLNKYVGPQWVGKSTENIKGGCADVIGDKLFVGYAYGATGTITIVDTDTLSVVETISFTPPVNYAGDARRTQSIHVESETLFYFLNVDRIMKWSKASGSWVNEWTVDTSADASIETGISSLDILSDSPITAIITTGTSTVVDSNYTTETRLYSQRAATEPAILGDVIKSECLKASQLVEADLETSALTQEVFGIEFASVSAIRSGLEPLRAAYWFDIIEDGYQLSFKPRGSASVATITADELGASPDEQVPRLTVAREQPAQLPTRVDVLYRDHEREYDQGVQMAERQNAFSVHVRREELAIAMTAAQAAGIAEVLLRLNWLERNEITFTLPPTYRHLQPGDVVTVESDGTHEVRIVAMEFLPDGIIEVNGRYNSTATYVPQAEGANGPLFAPSLSIPGSSEAILIDGPAMVSAYDTPGYAVAIRGFTNRWPGGILERTDDFGVNWNTVAAQEAPGPDIGTATTALGNAAITWGFDETTTVTVDMGGAELDSVTDNEVLAGSNLFAIGNDERWEIIGAATATLNGDGTYTLSRLLRGRFGTEWATGTHQIDDYVVPVTTENKAFVEIDSSLIGSEKTYRVTTIGEYQSPINVPFTYRGVNLEPYSPVHLNATRNGSNDWSMVGTRRTRIGGEWRDLVDVPLSEAAEGYVFEIWNSDFSTLKRTITSASPAATYTSAQQTTDFGSAQSTLYWKMGQSSELVGVGTMAQASSVASVATGIPPEFKTLPPTVVGMNFNGANGSTTFTDTKGHTCTASGSAQITTGTYKFGGASGYIPGGSSVSIAGSSDFDMGAGDFCVEFWINRPANGYGDIIAFKSGATKLFYVTSYGGVLEYGTYASTYNTATLTNGAQVFCTFSRRGGNYYYSFDGTVAGGSYISGDVSAPTEILIGGAMSFYIDDLWITKGVDLYPSSFTPPTSERT